MVLTWAPSLEGIDLPLQWIGTQCLEFNQNGWNRIKMAAILKELKSTRWGLSQNGFHPTELSDPLKELAQNDWDWINNHILNEFKLGAILKGIYISFTCLGRCYKRADTKRLELNPNLLNWTNMGAVLKGIVESKRLPSLKELNPIWWDWIKMGAIFKKNHRILQRNWLKQYLEFNQHGWNWLKRTPSLKWLADPLKELTQNDSNYQQQLVVSEWVQPFKELTDPLKELTQHCWNWVQIDGVGPKIVRSLKESDDLLNE